MTGQASFTLRGRNPDVLTCIANLSNDEVFTPPEFANRMLDTLEEAWAAGNGGADIWADSKVRFLDPCTKSGVFLREIVTRLNKGLAAEIPDLQTRVDHILTKQVFGIGITRLTFCGAGDAIFDRDAGLESHAYAFTHTNDIITRISEMFGGEMQFDVIIGNPPYQITGGGGGTNDAPIYQQFVRQAMLLESKFLSMVIPSRWMAGGRGLGEFRAEFLGDERVRKLVDYENAKDAFPTVGIGGGICYFLWERDNPGACQSIYHKNGETVGPNPRTLNEFDVLCAISGRSTFFVKLSRSMNPFLRVLSAGIRRLDWRQILQTMRGISVREMGRCGSTLT